MKLKVIIAILAICTSFCYSQDEKAQIKNVFLKSQEYYNKKNAYQVEFSYTVFKSLTGNETLEHYTSKVAKHGNNSYTKIRQTEFVELNDISFKINHEEKAIQVSKRLQSANAIKTLGNMLKLFPQFKHYKLHKTSDGFMCEFVAQDVTQLPFSKALIYFNKDYAFKKQVLHLAGAFPYEENGKNVYLSPRLEIKASDIKDYTIDDRLTLATYVKDKDTKRLSDKFSGYQLISKL